MGLGVWLASFKGKALAILENVTEDTGLVRTVHKPALRKMVRICMQLKLLLLTHKLF
jgi:hypothetical protein